MKRPQVPAPERVRPGRLEVADRGRPRTDRTFVARVVRTTLAFAGARGKPVSLLLTGDDGIAELHAAHLGDPSPTDVMSFDVDGTAEIVVNVAMARRVAHERGHTVRAEIALYIVHGLLHTLGYDDTSKRVRARMRAAEREVLRRLALRVADVE